MLVALLVASLSRLSPPSLLSMSPGAAGRLLGGSGRAKSVWQLLRRGEDPFGPAGESFLSKPTLRALSAFSPLSSAVGAEIVTPCGTCKLLLLLPDGREVEVVVIPHASQAFSTVCVSSQVGCRQACSFCATGTMGLLRSLATEEIVAQALSSPLPLPTLPSRYSPMPPTSPSSSTPHSSRLFVRLAGV